MLFKIQKNLVVYNLKEILKILKQNNMHFKILHIKIILNQNVLYYMIYVMKIHIIIILIFIYNKYVLQNQMLNISIQIIMVKRLRQMVMDVMMNININYGKMLIHNVLQSVQVIIKLLMINIAYIIQIINNVKLKMLNQYFNLIEHIILVQIISTINIQIKMVY